MDDVMSLLEARLTPRACDAGRAGWRRQSWLTVVHWQRRCAPLVCGVLPACFRVDRITYLAMTRATHRPPLTPLRRRHPARIVARHDVARWREQHIMTALPGTAECDGRGLPDLIVPVDLPHERV